MNENCNIIFLWTKNNSNLTKLIPKCISCYFPISSFRTFNREVCIKKVFVYNKKYACSPLPPS